MTKNHLNIKRLKYLETFETHNFKDDKLKMRNLIYNQDLESIQKMIDDGYDINMTDNYNNNCLDIAYLYRRYDIFKFFFNLGANVNNVEIFTINDGETLLYKIVRNISIKYFDLLITSDDLDIDYSGEKIPALFLAIKKLYITNSKKLYHIIISLIEKDAKLYFKNAEINLNFFNMLLEIDLEFFNKLKKIFPDKYQEYLKQKQIKKFKI